MWVEISKFLSTSTGIIPYVISGVQALVILVVGWVLAKLISRGIGKMFTARADATLGAFSKQFSFYCLMLVVLIAALTRMGVQTTSLVAIMGGMSVAVGLSLRSSLSNLASGILLVMFKTFKIGDQITVDSSSGQVTDIQLLFTYLKDSEGNQITIPNNKLVTSAVTIQAKATAK